MVRSEHGGHIGSAVGDIIHIWDVFTGAKLQTLVRSVAFSIDGKHLVSGSHDKTIRIWDIVTGIELHTLQAHSLNVLSVGFSPNG
jgi:WD40 repeat protein